MGSAKQNKQVHHSSLKVKLHEKIIKKDVRMCLCIHICVGVESEIHLSDQRSQSPKLHMLEVRHQEEMKPTRMRVSVLFLYRQIYILQIYTCLIQY